MNNIDLKAMTRLSYGLFVLSAREGDKDNGCIVNVVNQVTDSPLQIVVTVNKKNLTHDMILHTGRFNVSMLTEHAPLKVFEIFGYQSGRDADKFANCGVEARTANGILRLPKYINAYISAEVQQTVDLGSHTMFIAKVTEAAQVNSDPSLTYAYYQANIKPKPAATAEPNKTKWVCKVCGYVHEGEELPEDFVCPWCKHGASDFEKVEN